MIAHTYSGGTVPFSQLTKAVEFSGYPVYDKNHRLHAHSPAWPPDFESQIEICPATEYPGLTASTTRKHIDWVSVFPVLRCSGKHSHVDRESVEDCSTNGSTRAPARDSLPGIP